MWRRDRDSFDDRGDHGSGWQEPAHLGRGEPGPPESDPGTETPEDAGRNADPADSADTGRERGWEPPGWSLPPAQEDPAALPPAGRLPVDQPPGVPAEALDPFGLFDWAEHHGWTVSDGTGAQDASLQELISSAPVRLGKDHRAARVIRGRGGSLEMVAFDAVYAAPGYLVPEYAITAVPLLLPVPGLRLSPARFWKHRTGGLVQIPSGDEAFDRRWVLLAAEDGPAVRRLVEDRAVHDALLGSDDGDEFWSAAGFGGGGAGGFLAAVRPDAHRPLLVEHHARLLSAIVAALTRGA